MKKWRVLDSKIAFKNKWVSIRQEICEIHTGKIIDDYFIYEGNDIVLIFALTEANEVVLVKQYKHGIRDFVTDIPAGGLNDLETPEAGARRELLEETGYSAVEFIQVASLLNSPTNRSVLEHVFIARGAFLAGEPHFDETENCETQLVSLPQLRQMLREGQIRDAGCVAAIYKALEYLQLI